MAYVSKTRADSILEPLSFSFLHNHIAINKNQQPRLFKQILKKRIYDFIAIVIVFW